MLEFIVVYFSLAVVVAWLAARTLRDGEGIAHTKARIIGAFVGLLWPIALPLVVIVLACVNRRGYR